MNFIEFLACSREVFIMGGSLPKVGCRFGSLPAFPLEHLGCQFQDHTAMQPCFSQLRPSLGIPTQFWVGSTHPSDGSCARIATNAFERAICLPRRSYEIVAEVQQMQSWALSLPWLPDLPARAAQSSG